MFLRIIVALHNTRNTDNTTPFSIIIVTKISHSLPKTEPYGDSTIEPDDICPLLTALLLHSHRPALATL